jgi:hypothetical protein
LEQSNGTSGRSETTAGISIELLFFRIKFPSKVLFNRSAGLERTGGSIILSASRSLRPRLDDYFAAKCAILNERNNKAMELLLTRKK